MSVICKLLVEASVSLIMTEKKTVLLFFFPFSPKTFLGSDISVRNGQGLFH